MAASLDEILRSLQVRIDALAAINTQLRTDNARLADEVSALRGRLADVQQERDNALRDCEYLSMSYKLADTPERLIAGRRHISQLIRNIDKCIRLIKSDPEL